MALFLYYGKIGDGKSHHVVATEILPAVRDGRKIYCYMDGLNPRRLSQFSGRNADVVMWDSVDQVRAACCLDVDDREGAGLKIDRGALIVVDEAQLVWDAREWSKTGKNALAFMEYHRHFGLDVVLITQAPGRLDKGLVRLANECLHVKNLRFLSGFLGGRYVVNIRQSPQDREPVASIRGKFDPNVFACYRSSTSVRGSKVHGRGIRGVMLWGPAAAAVALVLYVRSGGIATLQGRPGVVSTTIDAGKVRSPESWPSRSSELIAIDPPVSHVGPARAATAAEPVQLASTTVLEVKESPRRVVGRVVIDGVLVSEYREGDSAIE